MSNALAILTGWQRAAYCGYAVAEKRVDRRLVVHSLIARLAAERVAVPVILLAADEVALDQWMRFLAAFALMQEQLQAVIDTLSEREAGVVSIRFGLTDGKANTLDQFGQVYGLFIVAVAVQKDRGLHAAAARNILPEPWLSLLEQQGGAQIRTVALQRLAPSTSATPMRVRSRSQRKYRPDYPPIARQLRATSKPGRPVPSSY